MDFTNNEIEAVINELEEIKDEQKDPGRRACITIAQMILEEKMRKNTQAKITEALKGETNNG